VLMTEAIKHHSLLLLEALVKARFSVATPPPIKDGGLRHSDRSSYAWRSRTSRWAKRCCK